MAGPTAGATTAALVVGTLVGLDEAAKPWGDLGVAVGAALIAGVAAAITAVLTLCAIAPFLVVFSASPSRSVPAWACWALPLVASPAVAALVGRVLWEQVPSATLGSGRGGSDRGPDDV